MDEPFWTGSPRPVGENRGAFSKRRKALNPVSAKRRRELTEEMPIRRSWLRAFPTCEGRAWPGDCFGPVNVDEIWPRGRGGVTDDVRNFGSLCNFHNDQKMQDLGTAIAASRDGLLVSAAEGPMWLAAGGRFLGMTKEEAIAMVMEKAQA